jgi:hypothetical protein|uniref:Portal protein n=1 Tax=Siphoviridae sp. ctqwY3 TaxID=2827951 RepID=A0A8S5S6G1_9CAUD|nr:MAG TPA: hypothetical protein [Siphoviridae sp. ctqwY3]
MIKNARIKPAFDVLQAPYIRVDASVRINGATNGKPNIKPGSEYCIAPSGKKIATYIVNQIFGSDLVTQTEGLNINWLMPTLKEALELGIYQSESFVYIHKFDDKIYLECLKITDIHGLVQKFDKFIRGTVVQEIDGSHDMDYVLERHIEIEGGNSYITFKAFEKSKQTGKMANIPIEVFNHRTGSEYLGYYVLPYEVIVNIDLGQEFFADSKQFLVEEMKIVNTMADEIEKTRTRIVTTQHYQSGDIVSNWVPGDSHYKVNTLTVGKLQDFFTLLPGDKEHQLFEFLQGDIRTDNYISTFKFYDYQCIQLAGLSPASFGYEKDAYMNTDNVNLSKNASDMTVEAIKTQIEPQINKLIENIVKAQKSQNIVVNALPTELSWDYGVNEKFDDMKKLQVLNRIQSVGKVPYSIKAKIIVPILKKLIDEDFVNKNQKDIDDIVGEYLKESDDITVKFGEV